MNDSVWREDAMRLYGLHGYTEARRLCIQWRNENSPGTPSFAFHNATLKALERLHEEYMTEAAIVRQEINTEYPRGRR